MIEYLTLLPEFSRRTGMTKQQEMSDAGSVSNPQRPARYSLSQSTVAYRASSTEELHPEGNTAASTKRDPRGWQASSSPVLSPHPDLADVLCLLALKTSCWIWLLALMMPQSLHQFTSGMMYFLYLLASVIMLPLHFLASGMKSLLHLLTPLVLIATQFAESWNKVIITALPGTILQWHQCQSQRSTCWPPTPMPKLNLNGDGQTHVWGQRDDLWC